MNDNTLKIAGRSYSIKFLYALQSFALDYRWEGRYGYDRNGAFSSLKPVWEAEGLGCMNAGPEPALRLCREFVAAGKGAFVV